jgi:cation diffusion facilitator family transporter
MANCCEDKGCEVAALRANHARVLWIVLAINAAMFLIEGAAGILAHSTSLLADALDMFGDALVYGFSLFVLARSARWQASAALIKGAFMLLFGLAVLGEAVHKVFNPVMPVAQTMGMVGSLALAANLVCFSLLYRHRDDNLNLSSTWLCSRNDLVANVGVMAAAACGFLLVSRWPDILVGGLIASLFLGSALGVLQQSVLALRTPPVLRPKGMGKSTERLDSKDGGGRAASGTAAEDAEGEPTQGARTVAVGLIKGARNV